MLAIFLLVLELLSPGFFFLWIAISAFITGCLLLLMPSMVADLQLLSFSVCLVLAICLWKFYGKRCSVISDHPSLNKRGQQYIGRVVSLYQPIVNGEGKIRLDDSLWKVHGNDCNAHAKVKIIGIQGTVFQVEPQDSVD